MNTQLNHKIKVHLSVYVILTLATIAAIVCGKIHSYELDLKLHTQQVYAMVPRTVTPSPTQLDKQASWIAKYAQKYARPEIGKSKSLVTYQLACLAHKENGFHSNDHCGDNNLACGEYQFHQATWIGFRKEMISEGLVSEVGSRLDDEQATETTAWAITHGHDNDWGPLLRGECQ